MDKNTTAIAKQVRLSQWAADIRDCKSRPTNVTVDDWCKNHGITKATYYWRLNAVRKACIESVEAQTNVGVGSADSKAVADDIHPLLHLIICCYKFCIHETNLLSKVYRKLS